MTISKWGKRVEEALSKPILAEEPQQEPSLQDQISAEAARLEIEQICDYLSEAVKQRVGRTFKDHAVQVAYQAQMAWYTVAFSVTVKGKAYTVRHNARDEDISQYAGNVKNWSTYMDRFARGIRDDMKHELILNGITSIETNRTGLNVSTAFNGSSFATATRSAANALNEFGKAARGPRPSQVIYDEAPDRAPSKAEEAAALASIQQALRHQGE